MTKKTTIKPIYVCLIVLVIALIAVSGCRKTEEAPTGPVTTFRVEPESIKPNPKVMGVPYDAGGNYQKIFGQVERLEVTDSGTLIYIKNQQLSQGILMSGETRIFLSTMNPNGDVNLTRISVKGIEEGNYVDIRYKESEGKLIAQSVTKSIII